MPRSSILAISLAAPLAQKMREEMPYVSTLPLCQSPNYRKRRFFHWKFQHQIDRVQLRRRCYSRRGGHFSDGSANEAEGFQPQTASANERGEFQFPEIRRMLELAQLERKKGAFRPTYCTRERWNISNLREHTSTW